MSRLATSRGHPTEERHHVVAHNRRARRPCRKGNGSSWHSKPHDGYLLWRPVDTDSLIAEEDAAKNSIAYFEVGGAIRIDFGRAVGIDNFPLHDCCPPALRLPGHLSMPWNYSKLNLSSTNWNRFRSAAVSEQFEASALSRRAPDFRLTHSEQSFSEFRSSFPRTTPGADQLARASARVPFIQGVEA